MKRTTYNLTRWMLGLVAMLLIAATPTNITAAGISFTNNVPNTPVIVQGASYVKGMLVRGQPMVVVPGKTTYDGNLANGFRQITIYDAKRPNVILLRKTVSFPGVNIHYYIRPTPVPGPYKIDLFPK